MCNRKGYGKDKGSDVHSLVDLVDGEAAVYLLHGRAGILHRVQRLLIDIRRLYAVNLALERHDLTSRLLERMLKLLLPP